MSKSAAKILWTGGWDSTFRLALLLLVEGRRVQPYYLIDRERKSLQLELQAMASIRAAIERDDPDAAGRLLPTISKDRAEIAPDPELTEHYARCSRKFKIPLGIQHDWLTRFAEQEQLSDLELSITADEEIVVFLRDSLVEISDGSSPNYVLTETLHDPNAKIFKRFRFPLAMLTKPDMERMAQAHGFAQLLDLTWSCLQPLSHGIPCGTCNNCAFAIQHGLAGRYPLKSLARHYILRWPLRPVLTRAKRMIGAAERPDT